MPPLRRTLRPFLLLALLQVGDVITTAVALSSRAATEGNETAARLMRAYGEPAAYTVKLLAIALVMLALWHYRARRWTRWILWAAISLSLYAVVNNVGWLLTNT